MSCDATRELAPELALGVLAGEERAAALAHVATCERCAAYLAELVRAADLLYLAGPDAEPPAGFESRVLRAVRRRDRPGRRPRGRVALAAAAALVLVAALGVGIGRRTAPEPVRELRAGQLLDHDDHPVGTAMLYAGPEPALLVSVYGWGTSGTYPVEVVLDGRKRVRVFDVELVNGRGAGGGRITVPLDQVRAIWVVDPRDDTWCAFRL